MVARQSLDRDSVKRLKMHEFEPKLRQYRTSDRVTSYKDSRDHVGFTKLHAREPRLVDRYVVCVPEVLDDVGLS